MFPVVRASLCHDFFVTVSYHGLFIKLMHRFVPLTLLTVLEEWFAICSTCVNWNSVYSYRFKLAACVRQGGVLSPILFVIYNNFIKNLFITKSNEASQTQLEGTLLSHITAAVSICF